MNDFTIVELADDQTGGYAPRGAVNALWLSKDFETIVAGPAETGKTWGCLQYVDALMWEFPGCQGVMIRKIYASLVSSALRTYLRIIGRDSPIKPYGGEKPQWFDYPNGSRLWVAGFDNPGKALSSERDFAYVNQAEELTLADWETLTTRCTGRGAVMPYTRVFGDCNPGPPTHWIKGREKAKTLRLLESRHEDNPTLFDEAGEITPQGRKSMAILDALTGVRKDRLRYGRWVQAEGVVYPGWDAAVHLIDRFAPPWNWPRYWSIDFGYTNPFVWQCWAVDPDGRVFLTREIYRTQTLVEDHARRILEIARADIPAAFRNDLPPDSLGPFAPRAIICDHDAEGRATLEKYLGMRTTAANKEIAGGIQAVAGRLNKAGDGKPRIFIMRDALDEPDQGLLDSKLPTSTVEEFDSYIWRPPLATVAAESHNRPDEPLDKNNHGMDALRYLCYYFERPTAPMPDAAKLEQAYRRRDVGHEQSHAAARGWYGRKNQEMEE